MFELDLASALWLLALALGALLAVSAAAVPLSLAPHLDHRRRLRKLREEVQHTADEHAARPAPVHRHDGHCPGCGRFAVIVSDGPRGRWTRCKVHGVMARRTKRIGRPERHLVTLTLRTGPALGLPEPVTFERSMARYADWLDGEPTPLARLASLHSRPDEALAA